MVVWGFKYQFLDRTYFYSKRGKSKNIKKDYKSKGGATILKGGTLD